MTTIIELKNLSKIYRLGEIGTGTISRDLERWYKMKIRGQEDPFLKIGETNFRSKKGTNDVVYSLRNINLEVQQGEALGIIGKNGAGKSTLLKIISRVTSPTTGRIRIKGRVASLLEIGTGFHPELTGRENIYLNGAILGMRKKEIKSKLDEIIDFSGVERFIDTPVKRYSSGMYVRLAFAVTAHLDSEILIVDEVLAVGDSEFQKKCLGKMGEVSKGEGRTVLFVSHNMAAVQSLCNKGVLLTNGSIELIDKVQNVITSYLVTNKTKQQNLSEIISRKGNGNLRFIDGSVSDNRSNLFNHVESFSNITFQLKFTLNNLPKIISSRIDVGINNMLGERVAWMSSECSENKLDLSKGTVTFTIIGLPLAPGDYTCNLYCEINNDIADWLMNILPFSVMERDYYGNGKALPSNQGNILLKYTVC